MLSRKVVYVGVHVEEERGLRGECVYVSGDAQ